MINMAVINIKDVFKYLVGITLVITIVVTLTRYFSKFKINEQKAFTALSSYSFISCLDETIPAIGEINNDSKDTKNKDLDLYKVAFNVELAMINSIIKIDSENPKSVASSINDDQEEDEVKKAETGLKTEVQESGITPKYTNTYGSVEVKNESKFKLTKEILSPNITVNNKNVLIYHTHTCESYTSSDKFTYKQTSSYRTTDQKYSVVRVGTELTNQLKGYGYNVIHDKTCYDYPSYTGSYLRSYDKVGELLKSNKNTDMIFDIHRDAVGDNTYAPKVKIGNEYAAQLTFVMGSNGGDYKHENWQQNLKFAVKLQEKANELYPGLFKPIILRNSEYNQSLAKGASIIEVGATGNTLDECLISMKYFAKVLSEVVK